MISPRRQSKQGKTSQADNDTKTPKAAQTVQSSAVRVSSWNCAVDSASASVRVNGER